MIYLILGLSHFIIDSDNEELFARIRLIKSKLPSSKRRDPDEVIVTFNGNEYLETKYHFINFTKGTLWSKRLKRPIDGSPNGKGYIQFTLDNSAVSLHRYLYEKYHDVSLTRKEQVDHINKVNSDNRIVNLRLSNNCLNNQNRSNRSGERPRGVSQTKSGKWSATITANNVRHHLGTYNTVEEASQARIKAEKEFNAKEGTHF